MSLTWSLELRIKVGIKRCYEMQHVVDTGFRLICMSLNCVWLLMVKFVYKPQ